MKPTDEMVEAGLAAMAASALGMSLEEAAAQISEEKASRPADYAEGMKGVRAALEAALSRRPEGVKARLPRAHGISLEVAKNLVDLFGGEETDMTVEFIVGGHSGTGFYGWCTEYPEDGSDFLGPASEHSYLSAIEAPLPTPTATTMGEAE